MAISTLDPFSQSVSIIGAGGHIQQRESLFMWIKILCIKCILSSILTTKCMFDVENMQISSGKLQVLYSSPNVQ